MDCVTKHYAGTPALDHLSLTVRRGEALGLLGPNGAGKTTLMHLIAGVLLPDAGRITVVTAFGRTSSPHAPNTRAAIGLVPQAVAIYPNLSAAENLRFFGRLYGLRGEKLEERVRWGLELSDLASRSHARARTFSGGMKRRLNLACAVLHEPALLLLDEPTVGVDPQARNHIFETLAELKAHGLTLCLSTHLMEEAELLCDRIAVIDHGQVLALDTLESLLAAHGGIPACRSKESRRLEASEPTLESVFLRLTGKSLRD